MEPEMLSFPDAVAIKQERNVIAVKEEYNCECSGSDSEERKVKNEQDPLSVLLTFLETQTEESRATVAENYHYNVIENAGQVLKFEEVPDSITFQENQSDREMMAGTSGVLTSSGSTSLAIPIIQHEHISESDVSETDVDMCSNSCDFCNKKFNKLLHLQRHTAINKDKQSAKFGVEDQRPKVQVQEKSSSNQIRRHICNVCNKAFTQYGNLHTHIKTHTYQRPFSCEICSKAFTQRETLNTHMRIHTGLRPFSCEICNKSFTQRGSLHAHMSTHTGQRPFSCEICNKSFTQRRILNTHMKTHTGQRPFSCEICKKSFTLRGNLETHIRTHTGQRPFSCEICNKSFTERGNLKTHMRTHTGHRPFSCEICNKSFTHLGNLSTHMKIHTGQRPFPCEICKKSFVDRGKPKHTHENSHRSTTIFLRNL